MNRIRYTAWLIVIVLLAAGCDVRWERGGSKYGGGSVYGQAAVRFDGFPIAGAQVTIHGPAWRQAVTSRNGTFTIRDIPEGRYTVTLQALHGSYSTSLWVSDASTLNWRIEPAGFDRELFYQISGLKRYYVDASGKLAWDHGRLVRWEQPAIRIYMDVASAPYEFDPAWPDAYWQEIRRWEEMLRGRVDFRRVYSEYDADIVLRWQPRGFLGDHAGIARHLAYYENGAIKRVLIEIDVGYGHDKGLWAHELAHGMGVDHVAEPSSVMYPWAEPGQRTTFSQRERAHVRLMYDIPSGQRLAIGNSMAIMSNEAAQGAGIEGGGDGTGDGSDGASGGEGFESTLAPDPVSGYRGHVVSASGAHVELDEATAAWLMGLR